MPAHDPATLAITFLDPVSGIIAGAIAAPLLLLLYFLKLRRRPIRVSSTMLWERAVEDLQVNAPIRWLRVTLLLILQAIALALLAGALARPAIPDGRAAPEGRIVILIDNSASMRAADADERGSSRLDAAKRAALQLVDDIRFRAGTDGARGTQAMVIEFAASPSVVQPFTTNRALLRAAIERIEPTDQPARFDAALELASAFFVYADEDSEPEMTTVALFSDGWVDPDARGDRRGLSNALMRFERVGPALDAPTDNLGIVAVNARRDDDSPSTVLLFLRVQNASPDPVRAPLTIFLDGEPERIVTLEVPGATPGPPGSPGAPITPGERAATYEIDAPGGGVLRIVINRPDALASDNEAHVVLDPPRPVRALVIAPGAPGFPGADPYLLRALESAGAQTRTLGAAEYSALLERPGALREADLLVFDRVRPDALPDIPSLSFGATIPVPGVGVARDDDDPPPATRFLTWRRAHPALRHVSLDPVIVARPLRVSLPPGGAGRLTAEGIAFGDSGPLIAAIEDGRIRRLLVGFEVSQSTWPEHFSFTVFTINALDYLVGADAGAAGRWFRTDEAAVVQTEPGRANVRAVGPITVEASAPDGITPGGVRNVSLGAVPRAGLYTVEGASSRDRAMAVNLADPHESAAGTRDIVVVAGEARAAGQFDDAPPREIWHWFVLCALVILTGEWLLYAWQMRV